MLESLAKHYKFDTDAALCSELPEAIRQHRAARQRRRPDQVQATSTTGAHLQPQAPFEGIIPNLERRYRETDSMAVREELAKYLSNQALRSSRRSPSACAS
jgi:excinuclease ABC subunit A